MPYWLRAFALDDSMDKPPVPASDDTVMPPRGRPRSEASRKAILEAAYALLEECGYEGLTMEGVAARAGVGKATIYRWWEAKGDLAMEAFLSNVSPAIRFPETRSAAADIRAQMRLLAAAYRSKPGTIVKEMIASSQSNPRTLKQFFDGYLQPRREAAARAIERGISGGEFRNGLDVDAIIDALYGPLFYRMLIGHAPNDDTFVDGVATAVLNAASTVDERDARPKVGSPPPL